MANPQVEILQGQARCADAAGVPRAEVWSSISSEWARARVAQAIRTAGGRCITVGPESLYRIGALAEPTLIYDLAPWTPAACASIWHLIDRPAAVPVILYAPPTASCLRLLPQFSGAKGICILLQDASPSSFELLCGYVRTMMHREPALSLINAVQRLVAKPTPLATKFLRVAAQRVAQPFFAKRPTVASIARDLGASTRSVERELARTGLPPPKEVIDWMVLLHVAETGDHMSCRPSQVARWLGYSANDLYRMKRRRLSATGTPLRPAAIRGAFVNRCNPLGSQS